jgi:hypothetical protein
LWRKLKIKFLLYSLKAFTTFENPLRKACSGFQVGTYDVHWRKWTNNREAKRKFLTRQPKTFSSFAHAQKIMINFCRPFKNIHLVAQSRGGNATPLPALATWAR